MDVMEKDIENSHISSKDNNKQATEETREMDQYTQRMWSVAILPRQKWKIYERGSHKDTRWKIYERTNRGTQLT